jgi:hypothetical protein
MSRHNLLASPEGDQFIALKRIFVAAAYATFGRAASSAVSQAFGDSRAREYGAFDSKSFLPETLICVAPLELPRQGRAAPSNPRLWWRSGVILVAALSESGAPAAGACAPGAWNFEGSADSRL